MYPSVGKGCHLVPLRCNRHRDRDEDQPAKATVSIRAEGGQLLLPRPLSARAEVGVWMRWAFQSAAAVPFSSDQEQTQIRKYATQSPKTTDHSGLCPSLYAQVPQDEHCRSQQQHQEGRRTWLWPQVQFRGRAGRVPPARRRPLTPAAAPGPVPL